MGWLRVWWGKEDAVWRVSAKTRWRGARDSVISECQFGQVRTKVPRHGYSVLNICCASRIIHIIEVMDSFQILSDIRYADYPSRISRLPRWTS